MKISGRNQLSGTVTEVSPGAVSASITKEAADELGLEARGEVTVIVEAAT